MKKNILIIGVAFFSFLVISCGPKNKDGEVNFESALDYNNYIIDLQSKTIKAILSFADACSLADETSMRSSYEKFQKQAKESLTELKKLGSFDGSTEFRDKAIDLFSFYVEVADNDYKKMLDLLLKKDFNDADQAEIDKIVAKVSEKETGFDAAFAKAQEDFAAKNNLQITKNTLQDQIDENVK